MTPQDVKYSFDLAKIATHPQHPLWADTGLKSTKVVGNKVVFTFAGKPGLPAVRLLPLQRRDRPAARLQELQQHRHRDGQPRRHEASSSAPARTCTSPASAQRRTTVVWKKRSDWWATKALGLKRRRRRTSSTSRTARTPPRCRTCSAGNIDLFNNFAPKSAIKGKFKTYYSEGAVPPRREHDLAVPEHDEEAAQRPAVPPRARLLDQHEPDPRQGLPGPRQQGEPDGPAADLEQVGRQEGRRASTASRTTSPRRRRSSPPPATRTRTATGTSRTRTARRSTSASSARTAGRTG